MLQLSSYQCTHYVMLCLLSLTKHPQEEVQACARKQSPKNVSPCKLKCLFVWGMFVSRNSSLFQFRLTFQEGRILLSDVGLSKISFIPVEFMLVIVFPLLDRLRERECKSTCD